MITIKKTKLTTSPGYTYYMYKNGEQIGVASVKYKTEKHKLSYDYGKRTYETDIPEKSVLLPYIDIQEEYRGKGYGSQLTKQIEEDARKYGMKHLYPTVVSNPKYFSKHKYSHVKHNIFKKEL